MKRHAPEPSHRHAERRHRARKRFGQHFLERAWVEKVVKAIAPSPDDVILEVGPGRGALTLPLLAAARHVVAFEIDRDLTAALRARELPNLTIIEGDVLDATAGSVREALRPLDLDRFPLRLAGNLPYNVASPVLFKCLEFVEAGLLIRDAIVMLQREVADRILAPVGTGTYGVLGVVLRHVAEVERLLSLPPGAFRPPPEVHSALIRLRWHEPTPMPHDLQVFRAVTRAVFTRRRKTLSNALGAYPLSPTSTASTVLDHARLDGRRRPETLDLPEFVRLADAVAALAGH